MIRRRTIRCGMALAALAWLPVACSGGERSDAPDLEAAPSEAAPSDAAPSSVELLDAAERGDVAAAVAALDAGAELERRDTAGRTALLLAVTGDHVAVARELVARGADPDAVDDRHDTPWLVTGVTGSVAMAEVLLAAEPDLTIRNRFGGISIIPASERGHVDYVRWVTEHTDIDVNHVNGLGWTALLEAVILGDGGPRHQEVARILLAAGVDRTIPDASGVTALQHAERLGYAKIAALLRA